MATVLVLDDVDANRKFLNKLLTGVGHRVLEAANGAEGLGVAKVEKPDLVIADVLMPKMDGYEFARALRADEVIAATPLIFYTAAYREGEVLALTRDIGISFVLEKPSDPRIILKTVERALSMSQYPETPTSEDVLQREHTRVLNEKLLQKVGELDRLNEERRVLLTHLVNAEAEERRRIASDIHDDSIQVMTAAKMRLGMLKRKITDPEQLSLLEKLEEAVSDSINRLRRLMFELRPPALEREGLAAAVEGFVKEYFVDTGVEIRVLSELDAEPPYETRAVAYQIATEALINVRKHAGAQTVAVTLGHNEQDLLVTVQDDGRGFEIDQHSPEPGHLGLVNMRERALIAGGHTLIASAPGQGTKIEICIPWGPDASSDDASEGTFSPVPIDASLEQ